MTTPVVPTVTLNQVMGGTEAAPTIIINVQIPQQTVIISGQSITLAPFVMFSDAEGNKLMAPEQVIPVPEQSLVIPAQTFSVTIPAMPGALSGFAQLDLSELSAALAPYITTAA